MSQVINDPAAVTQGLEALLAGYVAGSLSEPLYALLAAHLELSPTNRGYVRALEHAAGTALENGMMGSALPEVRDRDAKLAAIFGLPAMPASARHAPQPCEVMPRALLRLVGRPLADVPWKAQLPGIKKYKVGESSDGEAVLYWIRAGQKLPTHTHDGTEITLVLKGGFSDIGGHYVRGDVAVADEEIDHRPVADDDGEDCFCFAVTDAPLRLTGPFGRWVQPFLAR